MEIGIIMQSPAPNWVAASAGAKLGLSLAEQKATITKLHALKRSFVTNLICIYMLYARNF